MQTPKQEPLAPLEMPIRRPVHTSLPIPLASSSGPAVVPFSRWQKACDRVSAALLGGETRVVVTGPPGIGKTLLLDHISRVLRAADWTVMLRLADAAPPPIQHGSVALLVDEADRLSREALQQLLTATRGAVVLAGLDVLRSRVPGATEIALSPLGHDETHDYIEQWLALSGRTPGSLEAAALQRTIEISGGVPRLTSTLLGTAAWLADSVDASIITVRHVEEAAALRSCFVPGEIDLDLPVLDWVTSGRERTNTPLLMAVAASMLLLGAGAYVATRYYPAETERAVGVIRDAARQLQTTISETLNGPTTSLASVVSIEPAPKPGVAVVVSAPSPPPPAEPVVETQPAPSPHPVEIAAAPPVADPPAPAPVVAAPPEPSAQPQSDPVPPPSSAAIVPPESRPVTSPAPITVVSPPAPPIAPTIVASAAALEIARKLPPETISLLVRRGNDMMAIGDVFAARLLFGRAAEAGNADAMLEMGRTFDPSVLAQTNPLLPADPGEAARWYHRAAQSGNKAAGDLLQRTERRPTP